MAAAWSTRVKSKSAIATALAVAWLGVAAGAGQTSSPAPQPGAMVTVEGCVSKDDRPTTSSAAAQFVLTDSATQAPASAPSSSPGATPGSAPQSVRKMYALRTQAATIDLTQHIGRRVRVTGATTAPQTTAPLAGRSPEATPNPAPTGAPGSTGTPFDTANLPTLAVTALVRLPGTCR